VGAGWEELETGAWWRTGGFRGSVDEDQDGMLRRKVRKRLRRSVEHGYQGGRHSAVDSARTQPRVGGGARGDTERGAKHGGKTGTRGCRRLVFRGHQYSFRGNAEEEKRRGAPDGFHPPFASSDGRREV